MATKKLDLERLIKDENAKLKKQNAELKKQSEDINKKKFQI